MAKPAKPKAKDGTLPKRTVDVIRQQGHIRQLLDDKVEEDAIVIWLGQVWGLAPAESRRLIADVLARWRMRAIEPMADTMARYLGRLDVCYRMAIDQGDAKAAIAATLAGAKLQGLLDEKPPPEADSVPIERMPSAPQRSRLAELLGRVRADRGTIDVPALPEGGATAPAERAPAPAGTPEPRMTTASGSLTAAARAKVLGEITG